jgi:hypothetical protein
MGFKDMASEKFSTMDQKRVDDIFKTDSSPSSSSSGPSKYHKSTSTDPFSPILNSSTSFSSDENDQTFIRKESDDMGLGSYRSGDLENTQYREVEGSSLWQELDRDGINTLAIPSFILNSPTSAPIEDDTQYREIDLPQTRKSHPIHSLRKGISILRDHC